MAVDTNKPLRVKAVNVKATLCYNEQGQPIIRSGCYYAVDDSGNTYQIGLDGYCETLMNTPERVERWVQIYGPHSQFEFVYGSYKEAKQEFNGNDPDIVRLTFEGNKLVSASIDGGK